MPKIVSETEGRASEFIFPPSPAELPLLKQSKEYREFLNCRLSSCKIWFARGRRFRRPNGEWVEQRRLMMLAPTSAQPVELGIHQRGSGGELTFNRLAAYPGQHFDWLIWSAHHDRVLLETMPKLVSDRDLGEYVK